MGKDGKKGAEIKRVSGGQPLNFSPIINALRKIGTRRTQTALQFKTH